MSLSNLITEITYQGDGSTLSFPIPFDYMADSQVFVDSLDTGTQVLTTLTQGVEYTVSAPNAVFGVAPGASEQIRIYRVTPKTQDIDYIASGAFAAEDHERGMDRMVMMIQELAAQVQAAAPVTGGGALIRLTDQTVSAGGTVTVSNNQRLIKRVQGDTGGSDADVTTPIDDGSIDGQELRLVGFSDVNTLTIYDGGNVSLNGLITFANNTVLDLFWDQDNTKWVETGRRL